MICRVDKPYPSVKVEGKNEYYAKLLLEDYSSMTGELTSITQYIYQHFDKFNSNYNFSNTLKEISMVEMRHLELLGETIKLLGVNPKFILNDNTCLTYWSSSFIDYDLDIKTMLKSDIELEQEAISRYLYHISIIDDKYIKNLLSRIIEDERQHIKCFEQLLKEATNA